MPSPEQKKIRWGILGAADIARKNWKAIWNSQNGLVTAVASRQLDRSRRFIVDCQGQAPFSDEPRACASYDELLALRDVDAVYIPLPTGLRSQWVIHAAEAGKHVVCEKPCATSVAQLTQMLDACQRNHVQFMDGVMFMHSQRLRHIRRVLDEAPGLGRMRRITSVFTFNQEEEFFANNIRARSELEPDGCLGDLGWYCIRLVLWIMNWELPQYVTGRVLSEFQHPSSPAPVPTQFAGELEFADGLFASFYCSFITELEQWAIISGTRGHLRIPDFVLPAHGSALGFETSHPLFAVQGCDFNLEPRCQRHEVHEYSNSHPTAQESNLFRQFACQLQSAKLDEFWPRVALRTQQVMEACSKSSRAAGQRTKVNAT
jgi:predicted dehydrogenase